MNNVEGEICFFVHLTKGGASGCMYMCHVSCPGLICFVEKIYDADRSRWNLVTDVIGESTWAAGGYWPDPAAEISLRLLIFLRFSTVFVYVHGRAVDLKGGILGSNES